MIKNNNSHKNVTVERQKFTKTEKQYLRGVIHNLSFQRLTDQEIVQWLHDEKQINLDRSTVSKIRNRVEQQAEKWYIELKQSRYKYIVTYKERIDSLLSYQKNLHEIISSSKKPEVQVRAISELHSIEMSIFSLWKQLPNLEMVDNGSQNNSSFYSTPGCTCTTSGHDIISDCKCRYCLTVWCPTSLNQDWCPNLDCGHGIKGSKFEPWDEHNKWIKCPTCTQWFKSQEILDVHPCLPGQKLPKAIEDYEDTGLDLSKPRS